MIGVTTRREKTEISARPPVQTERRKSRSQAVANVVSSPTDCSRRCGARPARLGVSIPAYAFFAWLNWRTGSIVWSGLGHTFVLTLMLVAVGGAH